MPLTAVGELRIVPLAEIGKLGPNKGETVTFTWKWYYSGANLILWATLLLVIGLSKSNRNRTAMLVFVPVCITVIVWTILRRVLPLDSVIEEMFTIALYCLVVGIGIVWLWGDWIGRRGTRMRILCVLGILNAVGALGFLGYKVEVTSNLIPFMLLMVCLSTIHVMGLLLACRMCRRNGYGYGRQFKGWLALGTIAGAPAVMILFAVVVCLTVEEIRDLPEAVLMALVIGTVFGFTVYLINQLFLGILLKSPVYRSRFHTCLNLPPVSDG